MKKNIVIMILAILVLGLGGYLVYDKVLSSDNNNEIENNEVKEESYDLIAAKYIVESFLDSNMRNVIERISENKLNEETKLAMAIGTIESQGGFRCEDLFDITDGYYENYGAGCVGVTPNQYSYERVNKQYKKLFGNLKDAPKQDISYSLEVYDYSEKKDFYVKLSPQRSVIFNHYYYEVTDAKTIGNELKINISYLAYRPKTLDNLEEIVYQINGIEKTGEEKNIKQIYKDNESSLPKLTFVFEKENNNYILKSVE